jgi:hypothetical protein
LPFLNLGDVRLVVEGVVAPCIRLMGTVGSACSAGMIKSGMIVDGNAKE